MEPRRGGTRVRSRDFQSVRRRGRPCGVGVGRARVTARAVTASVMVAVTASVLVAATITVTVAGCAARPGAAPTLYAQLGERPGLDRLVDRLLREMAADERIARHFRSADIARFREQLTLHLCEVAGGPCRYEGASMLEVHRGMGIREADFNALVEALIRVMEGLRLPTATQNELLAALAPMQPDIVEGRRERRRE